MAAELAATAAEDQGILEQPPRREFARRLTLEQRLAVSRVRVANADRLREIVAAHGWQGRALVGEEGAEHAWLIAQHPGRSDMERRWPR